MGILISGIASIFPFLLVIEPWAGIIAWLTSNGYGSHREIVLSFVMSTCFMTIALWVSKASVQFKINWTVLLFLLGGFGTPLFWWFHIRKWKLDESCVTL